MNREDLLREKAKGLRWKKPIAKEYNLYDIESKLYDINEACGNVQWYDDGEVYGRNALVDALGDSDDAAELISEFSMLSGDVERMQEDLERAKHDWWDYDDYDNEERTPFDDVIVSGAVGKLGSGLLGYDSYEQDYFGLEQYEYSFCREEADKRLKRLTKDQMLDEVRRTFAIVLNYTNISYRFNCLKGAYDILHDRFQGVIDSINDMGEAYEDMMNPDSRYEQRYDAERRFDRIVNELPAECWLE